MHLLEALNVNVTVQRNDRFEVADLGEYDGIVLSPGPGLPAEAGKMMEVIDRFHRTKSILGVCLGHQGIAEYFGGSLYNMSVLQHGMATLVSHNMSDEQLFKDVPQDFQAGLYHSWAVDAKLPPSLCISAFSEDRCVMAIHHKEFKLKGIQFHPESILTPMGPRIIKNWVDSLPAV